MFSIIRFYILAAFLCLPTFSALGSETDDIGRPLAIQLRGLITHDPTEPRDEIIPAHKQQPSLFSALYDQICLLLMIEDEPETKVHFPVHELSYHTEKFGIFEERINFNPYLFKGLSQHGLALRNYSRQLSDLYNILDRNSPVFSTYFRMSAHMDEINHRFDRPLVHTYRLDGKTYLTLGGLFIDKITKTEKLLSLDSSQQEGRANLRPTRALAQYLLNEAIWGEVCKSPGKKCFDVPSLKIGANQFIIHETIIETLPDAPLDEILTFCDALDCVRFILASLRDAGGTLDAAAKILKPKQANDMDHAHWRTGILLKASKRLLMETQAYEHIRYLFVKTRDQIIDRIKNVSARNEICIQHPVYNHIARDLNVPTLAHLRYVNSYQYKIYNNLVVPVCTYGPTIAKYTLYTAGTGFLIACFGTTLGAEIFVLMLKGGATYHVATITGYSTGATGSILLSIRAIKFWIME